MNITDVTRAETSGTVIALHDFTINQHEHVCVCCLYVSASISVFGDV